MSLADKKIVGGGFPNESTIVRVVYDFAVDGGAIGDYDLLEADSLCLVRLMGAHAHAAVTSSDAVNLDLGKGDGGTEIWSNVVKASLAENAILKTGSDQYVRLAAGNKIVLGVEAFAITAGKVEFIFEVLRASV